jgi:hypothetical protein
MEKARHGATCACYPSNYRKRRIAFQAGLDKKGNPISKITSAKWAEGVPHVVEHLPRKHEALSSNPDLKNSILTCALAF